VGGGRRWVTKIWKVEWNSRVIFDVVWKFYELRRGERYERMGRRREMRLVRRPEKVCLCWWG
jgi:hypothetical protein